MSFTVIWKPWLHPALGSKLLEDKSSCISARARALEHQHASPQRALSRIPSDKEASQESQRCPTSATGGRFFTLFIMVANKTSTPHHSSFRDSSSEGQLRPRELKQAAQWHTAPHFLCPTPLEAHSGPQRDMEGHGQAGACPSFKCHPLLSWPLFSWEIYDPDTACSFTPPGLRHNVSLKSSTPLLGGLEVTSFKSRLGKHRVVVVQLLRSVWPFCDPTGVTGLLCSWDFSGRNTGMSCHFLLQGIFPTQGSNSNILLGSWILYHGATWDHPTVNASLRVSCAVP